MESFGFAMERASVVGNGLINSHLTVFLVASFDFFLPTFHVLFVKEDRQWMSKKTARKN